MAWFRCGGGKSLKLIGTFSGSIPNVATYDKATHTSVTSSTITSDSLPSTNPDDYIIVVTSHYIQGGGGNGIATGVGLTAVGEYAPKLSISGNTITISNTGYKSLIGSQPGIEVYYGFRISGAVYYKN